MASESLILLLNFGRLYFPSSIIWNTLAKSVFVLYILFFYLVFPEIFFFYFFWIFNFLNEVMFFHFLVYFFLKDIIDLLYLILIIIIARLWLNNALLYIFFCVLDIIFRLFQNNLSFFMIIEDLLLNVHLTNRCFRYLDRGLNSQLVLIWRGASRLRPDLWWRFELLSGLLMGHW